MGVGGAGYGTACGTIEEFISTVAEQLYNDGKLSRQWPRNKRVSFLTFDALVFDRIKYTNTIERKDFNQQSGSHKITAALVWSETRNFIKGSIAVAIRGTPLTRKEYIDGDLPGTSRKREAGEMIALKSQIYDIFLRYQKHLADNDQWDEMDRAMASCSALKSAIGTEGKTKCLYRLGLKFDRIYVGTCFPSLLFVAPLSYAIHAARAVQSIYYVYRLPSFGTSCCSRSAACSHCTSSWHLASCSTRRP